MSRGGEPLENVQPVMAFGRVPGSHDPVVGVRPGAWMLGVPGLRDKIDPDSLLFQPVGTATIPTQEVADVPLFTRETTGADLLREAEQSRIFITHEPRVEDGRLVWDERAEPLTEDQWTLHRRFRTALSAAAALHTEITALVLRKRVPSAVDPTEPIVVTDPLPQLRDLLIKDGFVGTLSEGKMTYRSPTDDEQAARQKDAEYRESLPALHDAQIERAAEAARQRAEAARLLEERRQAVIERLLLAGYWGNRSPSDPLYELPAVLTPQRIDFYMANPHRMPDAPKVIHGGSATAATSERTEGMEDMIELVRGRIIVLEPGAADAALEENYLGKAKINVPVFADGKPTGKTIDTNQYIRILIGDRVVWYERDENLQAWELYRDGNKEPKATKLPLPGDVDMHTFTEAVKRQVAEQSDATPEAETDIELGVGEEDTVPQEWLVRGPAYVRAMTRATKLARLQPAAA